MKEIQAINGVHFTPKEIDIIACVMHARSDKKTAAILGIALGTLEMYVQNIANKISAKSRKGIQDFIEKSNQFHQIKNHYLELIVQNHFTNQLKKISSLSFKSKAVCVVNSESNHKISDQIVQYLKLAGFKIQYLKDAAAVDNHVYQIQILDFINEAMLQSAEKKIFVNTQAQEVKLQGGKVLQCDNLGEVYMTVFNILRILLPSLDLESEILSFAKLRNSILSGDRGVLVGTAEIDNLFSKRSGVSFSK